MQDKRVSPELSIKEEAEHLRLLLALKLIGINDVVGWADGVILASEEPEPEIIEIALSSGKYSDEVMELLRKVKGSCDFTKTAHRILASLFMRYDEGKWEPLPFLKLLSRYYDISIISEKEYDTRHWVDYDLESYEEGFIGFDGLKQGIEEIRKRYRFTTTDNCEFIAS